MGGDIAALLSVNPRTACPDNDFPLVVLLGHLFLLRGCASILPVEEPVSPCSVGLEGEVRCREPGLGDEAALSSCMEGRHGVSEQLFWAMVTAMI